MAGEIQVNSVTALTESGSNIVLNNVDTATNRTNLGLGSIATQNANAVALTGGSLVGTEIDLKSSGTTVYASDGTTAVLSESGGLVTIADTVQHVVPIVNVNRGSSMQTGISSNTFTKVLFNNVVTDTHSFFDATTNYRFLPTIAGYYKIDIGVAMLTTSGSRFIIALYKNGSIFIRLFDFGVTTDRIVTGGSTLIQLNGSTDYLEVYVYVTSSNSISLEYLEDRTFFNSFLVQRT